MGWEWSLQGLKLTMENYKTVTPTCGRCRLLGVVVYKRFQLQSSDWEFFFDGFDWSLKKGGCKRMQQLTTMLGPAVHRREDTTYKSLETMCRRSRNKRNVGSWKFDWFQTLCNNSNNTQRHATTYNRVYKRTQHVTSNNVGTLLAKMRPFRRGLTTQWKRKAKYVVRCPSPE